MFPRVQAKTAARGYGAPHQAERREAAKRHQDTDPCVRCGHPLGPMGPHLHYDHNDDRSGYLGFSHGEPCPWCGVRCNKVAGAIRGAQVANGQTEISRPVTASRW